ncbi:unnamed protein product [Paramecium sonneborni]|uniref:Uncharacterized protein n=1 Tax=Paramecium sonneborni TaxID=65129 RepID=A0A8S1R7W1_9CILI|nr:unnamed protein product [Paramecium sonneborni]
MDENYKFIFQQTKSRIKQFRQKIKNLTESIQKNNKNIPSQQNLKSFNYQLLDQYSVTQNESCFAKAINKDFSTLVAGCQSQIKVFDFKLGIMNEIQILSEHKKDVLTLNFMRKQNQFISEEVKINLLLYGKKMKVINGLPIRYQMAIMIYLILNQSASEYGLSFNKQQDRLMSCSSDRQILIIQQSQQNKEWIVIQKITVEKNGGSRICFIDNNVFTFQPCGKEQMSVFEKYSINEQYSITQDVSVKCGQDGKSLFPQQYICKNVSFQVSVVNISNQQRKNIMENLLLNNQFILEQALYMEQ